MKVWVLQITNYENVECDDIRIFEDKESCVASLESELVNLEEGFMQNRDDNEVMIYRKDDIDEQTILHFQFDERNIGTNNLVVPREIK